ncbi:methyltransferase family protein [Sneathiella chinensis]|uniref:Protein-S-isoprenylcysteine methyltransferase n=1 Tax=Sneathiella chinensis TaxID=349750 RepID=A0ABQ5U285_9PROT|nr:isoprenylcysteine carboxylmethyltransferase family protein [Sneathiella chinensis]GLQ05526.1 protein-S-isoprenylcysteine methyltransferase [Sneathiella chinensis]
MTTPSPSGRDHPGVRIPPPLVYSLALLVGILVQSNWRAGEIGPLFLTVPGGILALAGMAIMLVCVVAHHKAKTNVEPWKPTTAIISHGLYGYSRNPIYVGMTLFAGGIGLAAGSWGSMITILCAVLFIQFYVIRREEAYLETKFGDEYLNYKSRVRRWL